MNNTPQLQQEDEELADILEYYFGANLERETHKEGMAAIQAHYAAKAHQPAIDVLEAEIQRLKALFDKYELNPEEFDHQVAALRLAVGLLHEAAERTGGEVMPPEPEAGEAQS